MQQQHAIHQLVALRATVVALPAQAGQPSLSSLSPFFPCKQPLPSPGVPGPFAQGSMLGHMSPSRQDVHWQGCRRAASQTCLRGPLSRTSAYAHSDSSDLCRIFDLSSKPVRLPCKGMTIIVLNATAGSAQAASPSALDYQRVCLASKHALVTMLMHP